MKSQVNSILAVVLVLVFALAANSEAASGRQRRGTQGAFTDRETAQLMARARTEASTGHPTTAIATLSSVIRHNPKFYYAYYAQSELYQALGEYESAIEVLSRAIAFDPNEAALVGMRADTYTLACQFDRALMTGPHVSAGNWCARPKPASREPRTSTRPECYC